MTQDGHNIIIKLSAVFLDIKPLVSFEWIE